MLCLQDLLTNVFVVVQFPQTKERHFVTRARISFEFYIKPTEEEVSRGSFFSLLITELFKKKKKRKSLL